LFGFSLPLQRPLETIDLIVRIVHRKRGPNGSLEPETIHRRLCAVMTGAYGNAFSLDIPPSDTRKIVRGGA
jgi:hypothetical protein